MTTMSPDSGGPDGVPEYQYEHLIADDAVRVLVVHPAERLEDPLRCSIFQYARSAELSLDSNRDRRYYSAVSYTWGAASFSHQLLIVEPSMPGTSCAAPAYLKIKANVDSLIRHLRKAHKAVHLWIDAVCLNQEDKEETARQIVQMGDIYRFADKVHIWLGDDNVDDARRAFSVIRQIELRNEWDPSRDEISLLAKLFGRAWFARRWVVQEAALAREARLHCGSDSLALSWMLPALKKALSSTVGLDILGYGSRMLLSSIGKHQEASTGRGLIDLLWDLHLSECSDPRDRIAALYGLASDAARPPDLRYNEEPSQLYWDCAAYFVNGDTKSAYTLIWHLDGFGSLRANLQNQDLPSWVPDWSRSRRLLPHVGSINNLPDISESLKKKLSVPRAYWRPPMFRRKGHPSTNDDDYFTAFINPVHMSAEENVLRICPEPLSFLVFREAVEEVYCCESSNWQDVLSLFNRMAHDAKDPDHVYMHLEELITTVVEGMWAEGFQFTDLPNLIKSSRLSHSPSEDDIKRLEGIGSILSRFSFIRTIGSKSTWLESHSDYETIRCCGTSFYHLGPRDATVGDFLVPFIISERVKEGFYSELGEGEDTPPKFLSAMICLKPTLKTNMRTLVEDFEPSVSFRRSARWVGLTFRQSWRSPLENPQRLFRFGDSETLGAREAYFEATDNRLPGPYVFEVI